MRAQATQRIRQIFNKEYGGSRNFLTKSIHTFIQSDFDASLISEISFDTGMFSPWIVGVTVLRYDYRSDTASREYELSQCFLGDSKTALLREAVEYAKELK